MFDILNLFDNALTGEESSDRERAATTLRMTFVSVTVCCPSETTCCPRSAKTRQTNNKKRKKLAKEKCNGDNNTHYIWFIFLSHEIKQRFLFISINYFRLTNPFSVSGNPKWKIIKECSDFDCEMWK